MKASNEQMRFNAPFSFNGRTRRLPFAMAGVAILLLWQLPMPLLTILLLYKFQVPATTYTIVLILLACLAWPLACFAARRLHDAGTSGWPGTVYLAHFALVLLTAFSNSVRQIDMAPWLHDSVFWLLVLTTAALTVLPGNKGENKFGADPRQSARKAVDSF